jgi:hypothetical protein
VQVAILLLPQACLVYLLALLTERDVIRSSNNHLRDGGSIVLFSSLCQVLLMAVSSASPLARGG